MTIAATYESTLTTLDALLTSIEGELATLGAGSLQQDDGTSVKYATLLKAESNVAAGIVALRGPGSNNAGPSDSVRDKLANLGL
jgi:hypothetical protein